MVTNTIPYNTASSHAGNVTINTAPSMTGGTGQFITTNGQWSSISTTNTPGIKCDGVAEFNGDIKWKGRNLGTLLEKIEDRLAILVEPDLAKLEKFAALKKAYDHYKMMEKLIGTDE
jgi:hypothetical protein